MRIFMLGWEFPPFISGGLGTACYGLTKALSRQHHHVTFVLPKTVDSDYTSHVKLLSPQAPSPRYHEGEAVQSPAGAPIEGGGGPRRRSPAASRWTRR